MLPYHLQLQYKQQQVTDQLSRIGGVELPEPSVADEQDGGRVVKDGRLLLQQFVEQALAPLQLGLRAHALRHFFVQAHDRNALAPSVESLLSAPRILNEPVR